MFRVRHPSTKQDAPVIMMQHGFFASGDSWGINKEYSPAFVLANQGYDVWMTNSRGNKYSRGHSKHDPYWGRYWDFGMFDLARDMEENIQFILDSTGQEKLSFVGHAHGAT